MAHEFLRQVELFKALDDADLSSLAALTFDRRVGIDEAIILAEEEGDTLFIIRSGRVKVSIPHPDGREVILSLLGPGEVFGELSLLDGRPRSADVTALEDTELTLLRRADFKRLLAREPRLVAALLEELASRLRQTDQQLEGLALLNVATRVSQALLYLAQEQGRLTPDGILLEERPPQQQIASIAGTTRETVSRVMRQLESQGYIICRDRSILLVHEIADALDQDI